MLVPNQRSNSIPAPSWVRFPRGTSPKGPKNMVPGCDLRALRVGVAGFLRMECNFPSPGLLCGRVCTNCCQMPHPNCLRFLARGVPCTSTLGGAQHINIFPKHPPANDIFYFRCASGRCSSPKPPPPRHPFLWVPSEAGMFSVPGIVLLSTTQLWFWSDFPPNSLSLGSSQCFEVKGAHSMDFHLPGGSAISGHALASLFSCTTILQPPFTQSPRRSINTETPNKEQPSVEKTIPKN